MAWTEQVFSRRRNSRTYANGALRHWSGRMAALHYESLLDSGVHDAPIDCTPIRINNAQLDGWAITANGWHYALGKPGTGAMAGQDGVVGFGGRRGQNWLRFRLVRLGYLHWPTRAWQDVGGAPTYARANLSSQVNTVTVGPLNESVPVESIANWTGLWATPGGGDVSAKWRVHGDALKEEITINQAAREWVTANRPPATPAAETWFGLVFRVDWSDIPKAYRAGIMQDVTNGDFADDGQPTELRDALDRVLAFMPVDSVQAGVAAPFEYQPLRKRFWKDGDGNTYLLVGVRCDVLAAMQAGPLVFDPTLNLQVGASSNDAEQHDNGTATITTGATLYGTGNTADSNAGVAANRFTGVTIAPGSTVASTALTARKNTTNWNQIVGTWFGEDADNAAQYSNGENLATSRTRTTASVACDENINRVDGTWYSLPNTGGDLSAVVQEIIDRAGWASGNALSLLFVGDGGSGFTRHLFSTYDVAAADAAKLDITYTDPPTSPATSADYKRFPKPKLRK